MTSLQLAYFYIWICRSPGGKIAENNHLIIGPAVGIGVILFVVFKGALAKIVVQDFA